MVWLPLFSSPTPFIMRNSVTLVFLFVLCLTSLNAQDENTTDSPYFNVFCEDTTGVSFFLQATNVEATVSGVIANVVVEQTYYNAGDSTVDATYVFPMSTNAAIYAMQMELDNRLIKAEIRRKDEAQEIFNNADTAGLTATLLEQERPNVFQMSLANIGAGDTLKVRMVYTELLVPNRGVYQFVFPSIVGPRFTVNGESWVGQVSQDSLPLSETPLNINLRINGGMAVNAECISHDTPFALAGNTAETALATNPGADFIVNYTLDDNEIKTGMLLYEGAEENFFLSMIQPANPDLPFESPKREYVFIMDISGSMNGQPIETSKALIIDLLYDLNIDDKFNIIFFSDNPQPFAPSSILATSENITMAVQMIEETSAGGSTMVLPALETALNMGIEEEYSRIFAILTDGYVTVEKEAFDLIRENLNEANFFAFGIGQSVNRFIIEGIAYVGEGEPFVVSQGVDPTQVADTFKSYIERPTLNNIEVIFDGIEAYDVEPYTIPDVFAERPIVVYGKYHGDPEGTITIQGGLADGTVTSALSFADYTEGIQENIALKYLWARKRIKLMSDYGIASNETDTVSIEEEITQLGLKYSLVTAYTSFVAVDSNSVAGAPGGGGDDDTGGGVTETDEPEAYSNEQLIQIIDNIIHSNEDLLVQLEERPDYDLERLYLQITGIDGRVYATHQLQPGDLKNLIRIQTNVEASGMYLISLLAGNKIIDTQKFFVKN
jgi:Ca-activated chloride channel family protein